MTGYSFHSLNISINARGVARVALNRPKVNAFGPDLIAEITRAFEQLATDATIKAVVLSGEGKVFSAGGDLNWMRAMADYSREENISDAMNLATMLETMHHFPKPLIGRIHGAAMGGGCGLTAVCDFAIAAVGTKFAFTEIKLGLRPSTISPYCTLRLGVENAKILFTTGETFLADDAKRYGLIDEVVTAEALDATIEKYLEIALNDGKDALQKRATQQHTTKSSPAPLAPDANIARLVDGIWELVKDSSPAGRKRLMEFTAADLADARANPEAKEKIKAFLNAA